MTATALSLHPNWQKQSRLSCLPNQLLSKHYGTEKLQGLLVACTGNVKFKHTLCSSRGSTSESRTM